MKRKDSKDRQIVMKAIAENCQFIKKVRKKSIVFKNHYWATRGYSYIYERQDLFDLRVGFYINSGGNTLYFS